MYHDTMTQDRVAAFSSDVLVVEVVGILLRGAGYTVMAPSYLSCN